MNIQKHTIYQISVPFSNVSTKDEIVFSRYILVNCFAIENINYVSIEVEEIFDCKIMPSNKRNMRVIDSFQFEERELAGSLHVMLGALSNNEMTGNAELTFLITLFTEIMFKEEYANVLKSHFPQWDIDEFISQSKVPGHMSELLKMKVNIDEDKDA